MVQVELNFNFTGAVGIEGSGGIVIANDGIGFYGSLGPSYGTSYSLGLSLISSESINNVKLTTSDVNGTSIGYGLGAGPFSIGWGNNTTSIPNSFAFKNIPTLTYKSIGLSIGSPVSFTYSTPTTKLFLKF